MVTSRQAFATHEPLAVAHSPILQPVVNVFLWALVVQCSHSCLIRNGRCLIRKGHYPIWQDHYLIWKGHYLIWKGHYLIRKCAH
eukprot:4189505-Prymnesium_polylepis.1